MEKENLSIASGRELISKEVQRDPLLSRSLREHIDKKLKKRAPYVQNAIRRFRTELSKTLESCSSLVLEELLPSKKSSTVRDMFFEHVILERIKGALDLKKDEIEAVVKVRKALENTGNFIEHSVLELLHCIEVEFETCKEMEEKISQSTDSKERKQFEKTQKAAQKEFYARVEAVYKELFECEPPVKEITMADCVRFVQNDCFGLSFDIQYKRAKHFSNILPNVEQKQRSFEARLQSDIEYFVSHFNEEEIELPIRPQDKEKIIKDRRERMLRLLAQHFKRCINEVNIAAGGGKSVKKFGVQELQTIFFTKYLDEISFHDFQRLFLMSDMELAEMFSWSKEHMDDLEESLWSKYDDELIAGANVVMMLGSCWAVYGDPNIEEATDLVKKDSLSGMMTFNPLP